MDVASCSNGCKRATVCFRDNGGTGRCDYGGRQFSAPQLMTEAICRQGLDVYAIQVRNWWTALSRSISAPSRNLHEEMMVEGHEGFVHWLTAPRCEARAVHLVRERADELDHDARHREGSRLNRHYFPKRTHTLEEHLDSASYPPPPSDHRASRHDRRVTK